MALAHDTGRAWFLSRIEPTHAMRYRSLLSLKQTGEYCSTVHRHLAGALGRAGSRAKGLLPVSMYAESRQEAPSWQHPGVVSGERLRRLLRLVRDCRDRRGIGREWDEALRASLPHGSSYRSAPKEKISVIAWSAGHNAFGRAHLLAESLAKDYDVTITAAIFPQFGKEVWHPVRCSHRVALKTYRGGDFPEYFEAMRVVAEKMDGDILYVSKPRLPSLELAAMAKERRERPIILDVDDYESSFVGGGRPLELEEVDARRREPSFFRPYGELWTRHCETLVGCFDGISVVNSQLQKRYGGVQVPHMRDEVIFDPRIYPRRTMRKGLGLRDDDRVIAFAGTSRSHKGLHRLLIALRNLNNSRYKLLIVGTPTDEVTWRELRETKAESIRLIDYVKLEDLPGLLCAADLICLLQEESSSTSRYQTPARFTDGLAMAIPMLVSCVKVLEGLAERGLAERVEEKSIEDRIEHVFSDYRQYKERATENRRVFLREFSYQGNREALRALIDASKEGLVPLDRDLRALIDYHRQVFCVRQKN